MHKKQKKRNDTNLGFSWVMQPGILLNKKKTKSMQINQIPSLYEGRQNRLQATCRKLK